MMSREKLKKSKLMEFEEEEVNLKESLDVTMHWLTDYD